MVLSCLYSKVALATCATKIACYVALHVASAAHALVRQVSSLTGRPNPFGPRQTNSPTHAAKHVHQYLIPSKYPHFSHTRPSSRPARLAPSRYVYIPRSSTGTLRQTYLATTRAILTLCSWPPRSPRLHAKEDLHGWKGRRGQATSYQGLRRLPCRYSDACTCVMEGSGLPLGPWCVDRDNGGYCQPSLCLHVALPRRTTRRSATLNLDVQPRGCMPTAILLTRVGQSTASLLPIKTSGRPRSIPVYTHTQSITIRCSVACGPLQSRNTIPLLSCRHRRGNRCTYSHLHGSIWISPSDPPHWADRDPLLRSHRSD